MVETVSQISQVKDVDYYMNLSYPIQLVYDQEEGDWEAQMLDLPDCMSDGADPNEAVRNVRDAQLGWVDVCIERGYEVPLPSTGRTFIFSSTQRKGAPEGAMNETVPESSQVKDVDYYMSLSYPLLLVYDLDDEYWIARVPDLPGCTSDGADPNEAVENIRDAQLAWIDSCIEDGYEVPLPSTENTYVSLVSLRKEAAV